MIPFIIVSLFFLVINTILYIWYSSPDMHLDPTTTVEAELRKQNTLLSAKISALETSLSILSAEKRAALSRLKGNLTAPETHYEASVDSGDSDVQPKNEPFGRLHVESKDMITALFNKLRADIEADFAEIRAEIEELCVARFEVTAAPSVETQLAEEEVVAKYRVRIAMANRDEAKADLEASIARSQIISINAERIAPRKKQGSVFSEGNSYSGDFPSNTFVCPSCKSEGVGIMDPKTAAQVKVDKMMRANSEFADGASSCEGSRASSQERGACVSYWEQNRHPASIAGSFWSKATNLDGEFKIPSKERAGPAQQLHDMPELRPVAPVIVDPVVPWPETNTSSHSRGESRAATPPTATPVPVPLRSPRPTYTWNSRDGLKTGWTTASPSPSEGSWKTEHRATEPHMLDAPISAPVRAPMPTHGQLPVKPQSWEVKRQILLDSYYGNSGCAPSVRVPVPVPEGPQKLASSATWTSGSVATQGSRPGTGVEESIAPWTEDTDPRVVRWLNLVWRGPFEPEGF